MVRQSGDLPFELLDLPECAFERCYVVHMQLLESVGFLPPPTRST